MIDAMGGNSPHTPTSRESQLPLIGNVVKFIPNNEIIVQRTLDLEEDHYLAHHVFVNAKEVKPISACLPVQPFTLSLEMMGEVSAFLAPGCGLLGFEDVVATEWIRLEDEQTLPLTIVARVCERNDALNTVVALVEIFVRDSTKPAIKGKVLWGIRYDLSLSLSFHELTDSYPSSLTSEQLYNEGYLFHGPLFHTITGKPVYGKQGFTGDLLVRDKANIFRSCSHPDLLTDPLLLDGVAQMVALWAMEREGHAFPIGIEKLELYRPTPPLGSHVPIRGEITQNNVRFLSSNIEVQDGAGSVWFRIQGLKMWVFHWNEKFVQFRRQPTQYCASENITLEGITKEAVIQSIDKTSFIDFDVRILAGFYLTKEEMTQFLAFSDESGKREPWLYELIVVKDVIRQWVAQQQDTSEMLHPAAFQVQKQENGQYSAQLRNALPINLNPVVDVTRTDGQALAMTHNDSVVIHVDPVSKELIPPLEHDSDDYFGKTIQVGKFNLFYTRKSMQLS